MLSFTVCITNLHASSFPEILDLIFLSFLSGTTRACTSALKEANLPTNLKEVLISQLENVERRASGKRYTPLVYKICLLLFHYSRSCYAALRQILILPSPRGLRLHLQALFPRVSDIYARILSLMIYPVFYRLYSNIWILFIDQSI